MSPESSIRYNAIIISAGSGTGFISYFIGKSCRRDTPALMAKYCTYSLLLSPDAVAISIVSSP